MQDFEIARAMEHMSMFLVVNGNAIDVQTKDGETVLQAFQRAATAAMRTTIDLASREKFKKLQQEDADRAMKELLEEDEKEKAAAAAGSQKKSKKK